MEIYLWENKLISRRKQNRKIATTHHVRSNKGCVMNLIMHNLIMYISWNNSGNIIVGKQTNIQKKTKS